MTNTADQVIKRFAQRRWQTEKRAGVDHYIPGQHIAEFAVAVEDPTDEYYLLAYATADGHGIAILFCKPKVGGWTREETGIRFDGLGQFAVPAPPKLSEKMIAALDRARAAKTARPR